MATFNYIAIHPSGKKIHGTTESESSFALVNQMRQMGITVISVEQGKRAKSELSIWKRSIGGGQKIKTEMLVVFFRQLATMVEAGVQLVDSLALLSEQTENVTFRDIIKKIKNQIEGGGNFSFALSQYPKIFPNLTVAMVKVAEMGGNLGGILEQLAIYIEDKDKIDKKIKSASSYPRFIMIFFLIVVAAVVFVLVPKFKDIFEGFGAQLPGPTRVILAFSNFMRNNLPAEIIIFTGIFIGIKLLLKSTTGRRLYHNYILKLPIAGKIILKSILARFNKTLGTLVTSGVGLVDALTVAGETANNVIIQEMIEDVKLNVTGGGSLAQSLERHPIFPPMMVKMIAVGEESGALESMLNKVSQFYERQLNATIDGLTAIIEPVLMIGLGVLALFVVLALYLPIFQMSGAISG
ncbi:MAG: type II secretion system F family protein [Candidatus Marinimicrobia bacterium]|nr:type II secretion system F family protein [Candidatus Neomarinimicrobiota bacterium]MCK9483694.1 type II secretion system F family protein [Candidatus Neomarinimicrobiota bacterium]MDD5539561.1 type II secretion system F family protein [Candidatus Neomarinimicrobiota bacterium]